MDDQLKKLERASQALVEKLKGELRGIRSSRPTTQLVENIHMEYAGQSLSMKHVGTLGMRPPREITITVWDEQAVRGVMKAIEDSKLGVSVTNEGNLVRVILPPLSEERRAEFIKLAKRTVEDKKIELRHHRDEANKHVKYAETEKTITKDQAFKSRDEIQKLTDRVNKQIEDLLEAKLEELKE